MSDRERIPLFRNYPYLGLFHNPFLNTIMRETRSNFDYSSLPVDNPYVGSFNHSFSLIPTIEISKTRTCGTQTDPVHSMIIGEKIIKAYGKDYTALID